MSKSIILFITISILVTGLCLAEPETKPLGIADKSTYLTELTELMKAKWPKNRTINIVCHGHSVPAGYFKTPVVDTFNAYPHLLHRALKERYPHAVINVIVTGIGGENSIRGAKRFEKDVLSLRPDLITIDYSLNDRGAGLEKAKEAWESMITTAKAKGIKVILLTPTEDTRSQSTDPKDPLAQHAEQCGSWPKNTKSPSSIAWLPSRCIRRNEGKLADLMAQINHPNRKGHELVVAKLMEWFPE
jgi:acyl-CoA thioesterase-1